jgi:DNA-binding winged helix-turn-helix (wHTH) protein/sugar lactone lactonase YvrE
VRYVFGPWIFDTTRCLLQTEAIECELDPLSFKLLSYFINQDHRIVSREELIEQVWQQNFVDDNAINRAISDLRKQLKTNDYKTQIIKTHYRKGYSFQLQVTELIAEDNRQENTQQQSEDAHQVIVNNVNDLTRVEEVNSPKSNILTTQKKTTHKNKTYLLVSLVALVILISCIVYFSSVFTSTSLPTTQAHTKQQAITEPSNTEVTKANLKPLEYSEEVLSWEKGDYVLPIMSKDHKLLTYAFSPAGSQGKTLRVKDMLTLEEYNIAEQNEFFDVTIMEDYYPITWFDKHILVYQITNAMYDSYNLKCEVWQVSLQGGLDDSIHEKLFDCFTDEIINADMVNDSNQLLYTKHNYRGVKDVSAIFSRDLTTGKEFQVSSPNIDEEGDYVVKLSNNEDKMLFLREHPSGTQVFIADLDGSNQKQLLELDYYITSITWDDSDMGIFWLNNTNNNLVSYDLTTKQLSQKKINSDYSLGKIFSFDLLSKNQFIQTTVEYKYSIDQVDFTADKPSVTEFIDSDKNERLFVPFNNSAASIYLIENKGNHGSIWHYDEGVRRKLLDISTLRIRGIALSPDDSQLLVATKKQLYIYDLSNLTLKETINLAGTLKGASWPQDENILLTYAQSLKTYAWFYNLDDKKLIKLTDVPTDQAKLINDDYLLFFNKDFQFIKKNIKTGESSIIIQFEKMSEVDWDADENFIYYTSYYKKGVIVKRSLTNNDIIESVPVMLDKRIFELVIRNTDGNSTLYVTYFQFKPNYLIELKLKAPTDED